MSQKEKQKINKNSTEIIGNSSEHPTGKLYLDILFYEYKFEDERSKSIDVRAGALISAVVVMITLFIQAMDIPELLQSGSIIQIVLFCITIICDVLCVPVLLFSMKVRLYKRFSTEPFSDSKLKNMDYYNAVSLLINALGENIEYNRDSNDIKAKRYTRGVILLIVSLVLTVAVIISQPRSILNQPDEEASLSLILNKSNDNYDSSPFIIKSDPLIENNNSTFSLTDTN